MKWKQEVKALRYESLVENRGTDMRNSLSGVRARRQGVTCCAKQYAVWYAQIKAQYVQYTDSQRGNRDPDSQCDWPDRRGVGGWDWDKEKYLHNRHSMEMFFCNEANGQSWSWAAWMHAETCYGSANDSNGTPALSIWVSPDGHSTLKMPSKCEMQHYLVTMSIEMAELLTTRRAFSGGARSQVSFVHFDRHLGR